MKILLAAILTIGLASVFPAYAAGAAAAAGPTAHAVPKHKHKHKHKRIPVAKHSRKPHTGSRKESK